MRRPSGLRKDSGLIASDSTWSLKARARSGSRISNSCADRCRNDGGEAKAVQLLFPTLFQLMYVAQHAARHADGQHGQVPPGLVPDAARHIDDDPGVQLDFLVIEEHGSLAG